MKKNSEIWKITSIYLIILNLILLVIFSGFIIEKKILKNNKNYELFELDDLYSDNDLQEVIIGNNSLNSLKIVVYLDYESSYSKKFYDKVYIKIKNNYIDNNKAYILVKDFPQKVHKNSIKYSQMVRCAYEQNKSIELYDMILSDKNFKFENLDYMYNFLNLNESKFKKCINSKKYLNEILINFNSAKEDNIGIIPTVIIGSEKIEGLKSYSVYDKAIRKSIEG